MKKKIIDKLNQLNQKFYQSVAMEFNSSRNYFWQGWEKVFTQIKNQFADKKIAVLDIGCGNGRFASFLEEKGLNFRYYGLDSSKKLLNLASEQAFIESKTQFLEFDIIKQLTEERKETNETKKNFVDFFIKNKLPLKFDFIVSFGVLHHLPSFELRKSFFQTLSERLSDNGLLVVTAWQFLNNPKLKERLICFESVQELDINSSQIEANDYLLDWQRGKKALRYCHLTTKAEMERLIDNSGLILVDSYKADSKTNNLNQYYILKKEK